MKTDQDASKIAEGFFDNLPFIHKKLEQDVIAIFQGDPAAKSYTEVLRTYPGFFSLLHRIAHELFKSGFS